MNRLLAQIMGYEIRGDLCKKGTKYFSIPNYDTDMAAAVTLMERFQLVLLPMICDGQVNGWMVSNLRSDNLSLDATRWWKDVTPAKAICRAALDLYYESAFGALGEVNAN